MQIESKPPKLRFIYKSYLEAELAFDRLKHLRPHIVSHNGHLNALEVDMRQVQPQGGMQ